MICIHELVKECPHTQDECYGCPAYYPVKEAEDYYEVI
jgi:hypothetical protein